FNLKYMEPNIPRQQRDEQKKMGIEFNTQETKRKILAEIDERILDIKKRLYVLGVLDSQIGENGILTIPKELENDLENGGAITDLEVKLRSIITERNEFTKK
ncbi:MAG: hypothetical protein ABIJ23_01155, partial [Candidatus Magasanikbacteria bacterium]